MVAGKYGLPCGDISGTSPYSQESLKLWHRYRRVQDVSYLIVVAFNGGNSGVVGWVREDRLRAPGVS